MPNIGTRVFRAVVLVQGLSKPIMDIVLSQHHKRVSLCCGLHHMRIPKLVFFALDSLDEPGPYLGLRHKLRVREYPDPSVVRNISQCTSVPPARVKIVHVAEDGMKSNQILEANSSLGALFHSAECSTNNVSSLSSLRSCHYSESLPSVCSKMSQLQNPIFGIYATSLFPFHCRAQNISILPWGFSRNQINSTHLSILSSSSFIYQTCLEYFVIAQIPESYLVNIVQKSNSKWVKLHQSNRSISSLWEVSSTTRDSLPLMSL
jgi:hypothetical protein